MRAPCPPPPPSSPWTRALAAAFCLIALSPACKRKGADGSRARKPCQALGVLEPPTVPATLALPADVDPEPLLRLRETGVQIYHCRTDPRDGTTWHWYHEGAEAELLDDACRLHGMLGAGPTWRALATGTGGGRLTATLTAQTPSPAPDKHLPWRRFSASSAEGEGPLGKTQVVVEVDTVGGKSPPDGCDVSTADARVAVPFQATAYFFSARPAPAGGP